MTSISAALNSLISGKKDVCCLCLNGIHNEPIQLTDDVIININNVESDTAVKEVLNDVFDKEMNNYIKTFNAICEQCIQLTISYYKFMHSCRKNAEFFTGVLDGVTNSFEYTSNEFGDSKSLFVSFNVHDFTSKHYYDVKRAPLTRKGAAKRFRNLDTAIYKCEECHKEFPSIWNLRNHCVRVHAPKKYKCPDCPRSYGSTTFLEAHRNESHCTVVCSQCGKTFYNRHTLKIHELGHHLSLVCQDCGRIYKNKATFKKHIDQNVCGQKTRAHPSGAKFTCDYCNKKYTQKMSLRVHIQYEHGNYKAHVCEWCGKKFWAQSRLKAHIVKHTKERNFQCTMCGGKYVSKESLLYHTRTHTGEKPYKCPHCEARFLSASRRSDHVKRHHLGGTFECDVCHSKFSSRQYLQKHKRNHTNLNETSYENRKKNSRKPNYTDQSKNFLASINLSSNVTSRDLWKIEELDEAEIQSFQKVIDAAEVQLEEYNCHSNYITEQKTQFHSSADHKVYLEVPDDTDDYL